MDFLPKPCIALLSLLIASTSVHAFYLPGAAPTEYTRGESVAVLVNALSPRTDFEHNTLSSLLPYDYYEPAFGFCKPQPGPPKKQSEALGSILMGDRLYDSPIKLSMLQNETCVTQCVATLSDKDAGFVNDRIRDGYAVNWLIDGLPAAEPRYIDDAQTGVFYSPGFALGVYRTGESTEVVALNNHYDINIDYHARPNGVYRIVGVTVWPYSRLNRDGSSCDSKELLYLNENTQNRFAYTYSVNWVESPVKWATRWDSYLTIISPSIHWLSLINSIAVAGFLCAMVGVILVKSVNKDLSRYNAMDLGHEDIQEDFGWKLVHAEVFRPPRRPMWLAVAVGSGCQLAAMAVVTLIFATFGFLSPSNRGSLSTAIFVFYTLFASIAGYVSSIAYATMEGDNWKINGLVTAVALPSALFAMLNLLNFVLVVSGSSSAIPFGTLLFVVLLWFLVSVPLSLVGSYFGIRKGPMNNPLPVNSIPRQIPPVPAYLKLWPSTIIGGFFPFVAFFIEFSFILSSLFGQRAYYAFGFCFLVLCVGLLTVATVSILLIYFQLCAEDYRWQYKSFFISGGSSIWILIYGLIYWSARMSLSGFSSRALYIGYLLLLSGITFLLTGSIGFLATYFFLRRIYTRLRID